MHKDLKLGNIYCIDYNDHFHADRVASTDASMHVPVVIQSIGRLVAITPIQYNLEHSSQLSASSSEYAHSIHGIMRSCITKVKDLGTS